ncbi:MAG: hypothetical protein U1E65_34425 [Myxococcota bacterium]
MVITRNFDTNLSTNTLAWLRQNEVRTVSSDAFGTVDEAVDRMDDGGWVSGGTKATSGTSPATGLTGAQLMTANSVIKADPALQKLLGVDERPLSGAELQSKLEGLPPERRELATSALAYNVAANGVIDAHSADPIKTFNNVMGKDLEDMPRSIRKEFEEVNGGRKVTGGAVSHILATKPAVFDAVVTDMAKSDDPKLKQAARDMVDQSINLPEDRRTKLLGVMGLDPKERSTAEKQRYDALQGEVMKKADQVYGELGGPTKFAQSEFVGTGDGTSTKGLLNKANRGVGLFKYELDEKTGAPKHDQTTTIKPESTDTSVLLDLKGVDHAGGKVTVDVGGHQLQLASGAHDGLELVNSGDFVKSKHPQNPAIDIYKSGDLEIQHDTSSNIFSVHDPKKNDIQVSLSSQNTKGDFDEVTLGVYSTQNPNQQQKPIDVKVPLTDAYELGSWKLNEQKVSDQFKDGLSQEQKDALTKHFADGGGIVLEPAGHGIGHLENGQVVDGASPDQKGPNQGARYTGVTAELKRTDSGSYLDVKIDSFTDDVPAAGIKKKLTPDGQKLFDDFLAKHPGSDPNDVLSALRSLSMMEHFTGVLQKDNGLSPEAAQAALAKSAVRLDDGSSISWSDYRRMIGK